MAAPTNRRVGCTFAERTVRNRVRLSQGRWSMHPVPAACGHAALRPKRSSECLAPGWQTDARCAPLRQRNHRAPPRVGTRSGRPCRPPLQGNRGRVLVSAFSTAGKPSRCRSPPLRPRWVKLQGCLGETEGPGAVGGSGSGHRVLEPAVLVDVVDPAVDEIAVHVLRNGVAHVAPPVLRLPGQREGRIRRRPRPAAAAPPRGWGPGPDSPAAGPPATLHASPAGPC